MIVRQFPKQLSCFEGWVMSRRRREEVRFTPHSTAARSLSRGLGEITPALKGSLGKGKLLSTGLLLLPAWSYSGFAAEGRGSRGNNVQSERRTRHSETMPSSEPLRVLPELPTDTLPPRKHFPERAPIAGSSSEGGSSRPGFRVTDRQR